MAQSCLFGEAFVFVYCLAPAGHAIAHESSGSDPYDPTGVMFVGKPEEDVHAEILHPYGPKVTERPRSLIAEHATVHFPDASRLYPALHVFRHTLSPVAFGKMPAVSFASFGFVYEHVASVQPLEYV